MAATFSCEAVLFDMDGTLTDSIQAVEAAWGKVAKDIGQDPGYVIAATHGKRAVDNLAQFKPHIKSHEMDAAVQDFEESILFYADAFNTHGRGSLANSTVATPEYTPAGSRKGSFAVNGDKSGGARRPSFGTRLGNLLSMSSVEKPKVVESAFEDDDEEEEEGAPMSLDGPLSPEQEAELRHKQLELAAWQIEATAIDRSVMILPGVKRMIDSIPKGRYAVATSGAKTYAYGCMTRVGITPPDVTITADDKRLKRGKPFPDPFLLAAEQLGYDAKKCVVFEDSPSGIKAGVASGATVIAVCTSHERKAIENCGAHYLVENMEKVTCEWDGEKLNFTILP